MKQEYDFSEGVRGKFYREGAEMRYPSSDDNPVWAGPTGRLGTFIVREVRKCLKAYREQPKLAIEHARSERDTADGGYASRQLFELVQNSADALLESAKAPSILIRLTDSSTVPTEESLSMRKALRDSCSTGCRASAAPTP